MQPEGRLVPRPRDRQAGTPRSGSHADELSLLRDDELVAAAPAGAG